MSPPKWKLLSGLCEGWTDDGRRGIQATPQKRAVDNTDEDVLINRPHNVIERPCGMISFGENGIAFLCHDDYRGCRLTNFDSVQEVT